MDRIQKSAKKGRIFLYVITIIIIAAMITYCAGSGSDTANHDYNYITLILFLIAGIACVIMLSMLIYIIKKNFNSDLNHERKQLVICQSVFVASFLIRFTLICVVQEGDWIDFTMDYPRMRSVQTVFLPLQFAFYNVLPYTTLMYQHYVNFKPQRDSMVAMNRRRGSSTQRLTEGSMATPGPNHGESIVSIKNPYHLQTKLSSPSHASISPRHYSDA